MTPFLLREDLRVIGRLDEDPRLVAGDQTVEDLANGAEAYLQLRARAEAAASR